MELFVAIALLCQVTSPPGLQTIGVYQLDCQQTLLHCVNVKSINTPKEEALNKCLMERKIK